MHFRTAIAIASILAALNSSCSGWPGVSSDSTPPAGGSQLDDTTGAIGSSCGTEVSCQPGLTCASQAPGGLCTKACSSNDDCSGGVCVWYPQLGGLICFKACVSDQVCRPDYSCQTTGSDDLCAPGSAAGVDGG